MISLNKRATIYLDPDVHRAIKLRAAETDQSVSEIVNDVLKRELLEDEEDLSAFQSRVHEPSVPYETFLKKLKADGKI